MLMVDEVEVEKRNGRCVVFALHCGGEAATFVVEADLCHGDLYSDEGGAHREVDMVFEGLAERPVSSSP
jgi:hypothetical protein